MTDQQPPISDETQAMPATDDIPAVQRVTPRSRRAPMARRSTSFVPPLWALALMLLIVAGVSGAVVVGVYMLGGEMPPQQDPIVIVVTAPPTDPPAALPSAFPTQTPAFTGGVSVPVPEFALEGPTLPPVILTPTPDVVTVGRTVEVINVGENGLNVRSGPGLDNPIVFTAAEDTFLDIIGGPEDTPDDSFTWWRVSDPFTQQEGWAVDLYMEVQPQE